MTMDADLIGHIKFLPWGQLDGCSVTRPLLSPKGVACETSKVLVSLLIIVIHKLKFTIV